MQLITKDEFREDSDYPELLVKTSEKEIKFEQGYYYLQDDTIYGNGECKLLDKNRMVDQLFQGKIAINDAKKIKTSELDLTFGYDGFIAKTDKKQFVFDESTYFIEVDTLYGKGKCISRIISGKSFESFDGGISLNDIEEIQTDNFNFISTHFDLIVVLEENEIVFEANNYVVDNDSITGKGKIISKIETKKDDGSFSGAVDINDVEEIQVYKFNFTTVAALGIFLVATTVLVIYGAKSSLD